MSDRPVFSRSQGASSEPRFGSMLMLVVVVGGILWARGLWEPRVPEGVLVEVTGAVPKPGLQLLTDPTVASAVAAAGGDATGLPGTPLAEGDRVVVAADGVHVAPAGNPLLVGLPVDINSADVAAFAAIPGLTDRQAAAIVADRHDHGPFRSIDDLGRVSGIGPATLEAIAPFVTLTAPDEPGDGPMSLVYLDHNATSPLLPEVLDAMRPWLGVPANPASAHRAGQRAMAAVERAREAVAELVGGNPAGVVFTSGATEANHLYLRGIAQRRPLVVSAIEHPCVLAAARAATDRVHTWPAGPDGVVVPGDLPEGTAAVSLMAANHETGVLQPLDEALAIARRAGAALHVDATQAAGRVPITVAADAIVLSSHKIGGPAGVGALILRDGEPFPPLLSGGAQERGRRGGTVNVAGVVGFAEACRLARRDLVERSAREQALSSRLRAALVELGGRIVGDPARLLPNTTCVIFPGLRGETLVQALDLRGICASSGAACASGSLEPSPVLRAMGDPEPAGGLRLSLGPTSAATDVDALLEALPGVLRALAAEG